METSSNKFESLLNNRFHRIQIMIDSDKAELNDWYR